MAKYVFPILLFLYPLFWMNQGIDVSDPMYSLTNFRFFPPDGGKLGIGHLSGQCDRLAADEASFWGALCWE